MQSFGTFKDLLITFQFRSYLFLLNFITFILYYLLLFDSPILGFFLSLFPSDEAKWLWTAAMMVDAVSGSSKSSNSSSSSTPSRSVDASNWSNKLSTSDASKTKTNQRTNKEKKTLKSISPPLIMF